MGRVVVTLQNGDILQKEYEKLRDIYFHHHSDAEDYDSCKDSGFANEIAEIRLTNFNLCTSFNNNINNVLNQLRHNQIIKKIKIVGGTITDIACLRLAEFIISHQSLETLTIKNLFLINQDVSSLIEAISESQSLKAVDFSDNNFNTNITAALAKALHNKTLKSLNLSGNFIGEEAVNSIVALLNNGTLTELKIDGCSLSKNSVKLLAEALKSNQTLRTLSMAGVKILTDEAIQSLADVITHNTGLMSLNLSDCCHQQGRELLTNALQNNYTLIKFEIKDSYAQLGDQYGTISEQSPDYNSCIEKVNHILDRNENLLSSLATGLIARTQNQSMLHAFSETYKYIMRDYLIEHKKLTLTQADEVIAEANANYNLIDALFKYGLIAKKVDLPDDILNEIARFALPQGHRAMVEAQRKAKDARVLVQD